MKWGILFSLIFIFVSCLPSQEYQTRTDSASAVSDSSDSGTSDNSTTNIESTVSWLNSGLSSKVLSINFDNTKTVYLFGDQVNNFLSNSDNFKADYCLEARYTATSSTTPQRLRVKVSPGISNNINRGTITRYFAVNLGTDNGNSFCDRSSLEQIGSTQTLISSGDSNYDGIINASDTSIVFKPSDVCPTCTNIIASSQLILYQNNENGTSTVTTDDYLERVALNQVAYSELTLRIDLNGNSDNGQSSCTDTQCQGQGFDCCIEGQCVNEAGVKVSAVMASAASQAAYMEAEQQKLTDPNWYKNYPEFYYICLEAPPIDVDPDDPNEPDDPIGEAEDRLLQLTSDNTCLVNLDDNSESDPFHIDFLSGDPTCSECAADVDPATCTKQVMQRLYDNCGCSEATLNDSIQNCPAYTYNPIYQTGNDGQPTDTVLAFECVSPPVEQTPLPFSDLEVTVNSRSAPHRFFNEDGVEIDPTQAIPSGVNTTQEGTEFQYLDDFYIFPRNDSFNINSILGQMTVALNQARPATVIDLEFDKQYLIATRNGTYISCPTCARDSWFSNFSPFPNAQTGIGIQAIGYSTRRDTFETNTTLGNYADTKFSRACYIPPTMIPFSHSTETTTLNQRQKRLQTQAALFVNGYQKDWYGFNRGALIGSFDGVTWFAIGKGRRVRATSNKLFLAINAPFADLASPSEHVVSVQEYDFTSTAPLFDYDPAEEINSATQNEAGSCQFWHQCETDTDCITRLGWEYACADVSLQQTSWPQFDPSDASEVANTSRTGTIIDFLQQATLPPGSDTKRCVYRGAGAPCRIDYENVSDEGIRKHLTCAPNFYCAGLSDPDAFNDEIARFGRPLDELIESKNHFYGMDANILGRPKHYINDGNLVSLPIDVQNRIEDNLSLMDASGTGQFGLCRPGKKLPEYNGLFGTTDWEYSEQHRSADADGKTDFISQIAGCNSALFTDLRYSSCPMLDQDGNYVHTQQDFIDNNFELPDLGPGQAQDIVVEKLSYSQNACGLEALSSDVVVTTATDSDFLAQFSAFESIEAPPLTSSNTIIEPILARDACLRKAGAVCHTDLDCSPNRMMASVVDLVDPSYFGNEAEKKYYEEFLICGQAEEEPKPGDSDYFEYNMSNNRCCRPIGESLTMYTEDSPNAVESQGLTTHVFGSLNPTSATRYSRYSSVDATVNTVTKTSNLIRPTANTDDIDLDGNLDNATNITDILQWTTIHEAAAKTCCGGNWVREFEDGTNDWTVVNRLNISLSNYQCLNYRSHLLRTEDAATFGLTQAILDKDKIDFCLDPTFNASGCIQHSIDPITSFSVVRPRIDQTEDTMEISTNTDYMQSRWQENIFAYGQLQSAVDGSFSPFLDWENDPNNGDEVQKRYISVRLPSYITFDDIGDLIIEMTDPSSLTNPSGSDSNRIQCTTRVVPSTYSCSTFSPGTLTSGPENGGLCWRPGEFQTGVNTALWDTASGACAQAGDSDCCYTYNPTSRVLSVAYNNTITTDVNSYGNHNNFLRISNWLGVGSLGWELNYVQNATNFPSGVPLVGDVSAIEGRRGAEPGNALYYLKKLAKLEYLGIPQMTYEPIYCNDNYQKIVPGIFKEEVDGAPLTNVVEFLNHPRTFIDDNVDSPWQSDGVNALVSATNLNQNFVGTQEIVDKPQIFSDNQFKCCLELGTPIDEDGNQSMCCTGFAADDSELSFEMEQNDPGSSNNKIFCKLPTGTNLNVYFNKFVSGEGLGDDMGVNPLDEGDFDAVTGEPRTSLDVINKLVAIGDRFCQNNVTRRGAVIGNFRAQPVGSQGSVLGDLNSIADSSVDNGNANNVIQGADMYNLGYKWNHHVYCDIGNQ